MRGTNKRVSARPKGKNQADFAMQGGAKLVSYTALLWPLFSQWTGYLDVLTVN